MLVPRRAQGSEAPQHQARLGTSRQELCQLGVQLGAREQDEIPRGDIMDLYTSLPWESLCADVSKLRIQLLGGKLLAMVAESRGGGRDLGTFLGTVAARAVGENQKGPENQALRAFSGLRGGRDSNLKKAI